MNKDRSLIVAGLLLIGSLIVTRLLAGPVLTVKYDLLFMGSHGGGYIPTGVALCTKSLYAILAVISIVAAFKAHGKRSAWLLMGIASIVAFALISSPSDKDIAVATNRGDVLRSKIEAFHRDCNSYPLKLSEIADVPDTGLAKERRFYYASSKSKGDDHKGYWFAGAKTYIGNAQYVICIPLVPGGTLVYRPNNDYSDLPGRPMSHGWFLTVRD